MSELHVVATIPAMNGSEEIVRGALTTLGEATRGEAGCLAYDLFESASTPGTFVTVERWRGQDDLDAHLGQRVTDGERLGALVDSFGRTLRLVHANRTGIVIGRTEAPLVNSGDALVHIAT